MTLQQFYLLIDRLATDDEIDALFEKYDDLGIGGNHRHGTSEVSVDREAPTLLDAVLSAIGDLDAIGLHPTGVVDDDTVTLEDIAARLGRSREAVRLWSVGRVGPGGFPGTITPGQSTSYYRWSQVAPWLRERMGLDVPDPEPVLAAVNLALQLRALAPRVSRMEAVRALIPAA